MGFKGMLNRNHGYHTIWKREDSSTFEYIASDGLQLR
jgi:hypothetical protein